MLASACKCLVVCRKASGSHIILYLPKRLQAAEQSALPITNLPSAKRLQVAEQVASFSYQHPSACGWQSKCRKPITKLPSACR